MEHTIFRIENLDLFFMLKLLLNAVALERRSSTTISWQFSRLKYKAILCLIQICFLNPHPIRKSGTLFQGCLHSNGFSKR